jgi:hypothetical protein
LIKSTPPTRYPPGNGEDRDFQVRALWRPKDEETLEKPMLGFVQPQVDLRQRPGQHQHHAQRQAHHRQTKRGEKRNEAIKKHWDK